MIPENHMTTTSIRPRVALVSALSALALAGCGGLGSDATIGGTVSGLGSGLTVVLADNGGDNLTVASNGAFTFATHVAAGAGYSVTVVTQPVGQTCTVANASGTVATTNVANISNVTVTCVATASVTGTVIGLTAGTAVTLSNNGGTPLTIGANGAFAIPGVIAVGSAYAVTVTVQPVGHNCTLTNASGVIPTTGVVAVTVTCT
jgi:hypothetical protein